jgi:hypothetical protein
MTWIDQIRSVVTSRPQDVQAVAGKLYPDRDTQVMTAEEILRTPLPDRSSPSRAPFVAPGSLPGMNPFRLTSPAPPIPETPMRTPAPAAQHAAAQRQWSPTVELPPAAAAAVPPIKLAPKPTIDVEPKGTARQVEPSHDGKAVALSSYVQGLMILPFRSPGHERI